MTCRFDRSGEYDCGKANCILCPGHVGDRVPADDRKPRRVRDRSNRNPACVQCKAPIIYEPGQYTRQRCPPCTKAHNNARDQLTAHRKDVKAWTMRMTTTAKRIGPT